MKAYFRLQRYGLPSDNTFTVPTEWKDCEPFILFIRRTTGNSYRCCWYFILNDASRKGPPILPIVTRHCPYSTDRKDSSQH
ncbi:hypothetical protein CEXT_625941 [Caerostris extrusa]|uniref:Uncharacterized protein n=1 Tax=Caerostris extrusa TaxID=172846 RepID=A0AAV4WV31_CAEEX|nr:hypothetical protein CEXT_625941 [Caerostris extrusa]